MAGFPIVNLNHKQKWWLAVWGDGGEEKRIVNNLNFTTLHKGLKQMLVI
jgi:hypothetical protein